MRESLREIAVYAALLVLVLIGIWSYRTYKQDVLDYSLEFLGKRLVSMVQDENDRAVIESMYARFVERVRAREVATEQIEMVAANILDLSHRSARLDPKQVEVMLMLPEVPPMALPELAPDSSSGDSIRAMRHEEISLPGAAPAVVAKSKHQPSPPSPEKLGRLGERLKALCDFEASYRNAIASHDVSNDLLNCVQFQADGGLKIILDPAIRERMQTPGFRRVEQMLARLERDQLLAWERALQEKREVKWRKLREGLHALVNLQAEVAPQTEKRESVRLLIAMKELEVMRYARALPADSLIQAEVQAEN